MNNLGRNIKHLRKTKKYSQIELAEKLGVSQTSIAHYEKGTRQPTIETLIELSQLFNKPIDDLVGNSVIKVATKININKDNLVESLVNLLVSKNEDQFIKTFEESVYPTYEIKSLIDNVLKRVMYKIGDLWEQGVITEADEHYATNVVRKVINYINIKNSSSIKDQKAISFTVGSEKHTLGIEMVNTCLESEGIDTLYLGNNVPIKSLEKIINEQQPEYVFISITMNDSMNSLVHLIDYLNDKFNSKFIIGVGGQGLDKENLQKHKNIRILSDIKALLELLNR